jgi:simple sugar transport system permease protein
VALLGRNSCLGVVLSALLFGALQTGSLALDIETEGVTREMTLVIQAALILTLASEKVFRPFLGRVLRG